MPAEPAPNSERPASPTTPDAEAEATMREFIDYTEYLPSDIRRYLNLAEELETRHRTARDQLEADIWQYAHLAPSTRALPPTADASLDSGRTARPSELVFELENDVAALESARQAVHGVSDKEMQLRFQISQNLNTFLKTRQEKAAEVNRLFENISRHHSRIVLIYDKLSKTEVPNDPTPPPEPEPEPRSKSRGDESTRMRITLRLNNAESSVTASNNRRRPAMSSSGLATMTEEDWEAGVEPITPFPRDRFKKKHKTTHKKAPKAPPADPLMSGGAPARYPDGTAIPNDKLPWNQLTNEELARLRKRMKKNSAWTPSVTMIVRELEVLQRGPTFKDDFREQWEGKEDQVVGPEDGGIGDPLKIQPEDGVGSRENKGMKLNRAKKRKREEERKEKEAEKEREREVVSVEHARKDEKVMAREQQVQLERQTARLEQEQKEREANEKATREKEEQARISATKAEAAKAIENAKQNTSGEAAETTTSLPIRTTRAPSISSVKSTHSHPGVSLVSDNELSEPEDIAMTDVFPETPAPPTTRNRRPSKPLPPATEPKKTRGNSAVPPTPAPEKRPKRGSVSMTASSPPPLTANRKRSSSVADPTASRSGATATKSKPKANGRISRASTVVPAPNKKRAPPNSRRRKTASGQGGETQAADEEEEDTNKYCLCDRVSMGTMVACENDECPKVWFHIACVGLTEAEAQAEDNKWYCPLCRGPNASSAGRAGKRRRKA